MSEIFVAGTKAARLKRQSEDIKGEETLSAYYRDLFTDENEASRHVIADLSIMTGYFDVMPPEATDEQIRTHNAMRTVFQRILDMAELAPERIAVIQRSIERIKASQAA